MRKLLAIAVALAPLMLWAQFNPQPKRVTEKFFPDFDMEIPTPAFQKNGGFTTHKEMMAFIDALVAKHPDLLSYEVIGTSQKGKAVPLLTLNKGSLVNADKVRVWMQGGLHGDEPASTEGVLFLVHQLLEEETLRSLLDDVVIQIIPMANVDGCDKLHRHAANGLDLNRDQTKFTAPESKFLKEPFNAFNPEVALDFHEFRPYRRDFAKLSDWGVTTKYDVMFLYSGNPNVHPELRQFTKEAFVADAGQALDEYGLLHSDYFTSTKVHGEIQFNRGATNPRSSATSYALTNCVASLIEVRGVALGRTSYRRRVFTTYTIGLSYLYTAIEKKPELRTVLARAAEQAEEAVVVKSKRTLLGEEVPFIDLASNDYITLPAIVRDAWQAKPVLIRQRPEAYYILAGEDKAIENLRILGLEVEKLANAITLEVESYTVEHYKRSPFRFEGVHMQEVECSTERVLRLLPEGTYRVSSRQKHGNMLTELLEPEASSGFVAFEVIKTQLGAELPVFRSFENKNP